MKTSTLVLVCFGVPASQSFAVDVWLTRGDQVSLLEERPDVAFLPGTGTRSTQINLDPTITFQTMDGFGAAMTDSSAWLLENKMTSAQRDALMDELFSPTSGIGLNYLRLPMGASDFALTPYTYNDLPAGQTDPTLSQFSIAYDEPYIIPRLQQAQAINPSLQIMGTPWSPPAWMKTTQSLNGGQLDTTYHDAYAQYFVKFIEAYEAHGLPIDAITVINEPLFDTTDHPTTSMTTFQQSTFIGDFLGPAFAANDIDTKIIAFDHNWSDWNYPVVVLNDPEANPFIAGSAFHGYAGDVDNQSLLHNFFPDKEIHFTELTGGDFAPNFADNLVFGIENVIIGSTRNWSRTALYWNLALDENNGPRIGGCPDCRGVVTIDSNTGDVTFEEEYYILAHASKFVEPGAVRIGSDTIDGVIETVAFKNPDGSEVLIALNPSNQSRWFDVVRDGEHFSYRLTSKSVVTFAWDTVLQGDLDADGDVDQDDIDLLFANLGDPAFDLDGDGDADADDITDLVENILGTRLGDLDLNGVVDANDFGVFAGNFGQLTGQGYASGDLNGDLGVDANDFGIFAGNFGTGTTDAASVPEPAGLIVLAVAAPLFIRRRA